MAAPSAETVSVRESPLPPLAGENPLSPAQWTTLLAFADAVVPSIAPSATAAPATQLAVDANDYATALANVQHLAGPDVDPDLSAEYLAETPSACPAFRENIHRLMAQHIPVDVRKQLLMVLNVLDTRPGALVMTGYSTPFAEQPVHIRIAILQSWRTARTPIFRQLNRLLTTLVKQNWAKSSATLSRVLGFPRFPVHATVGKGYDFEFIQVPPGDGPETIETDVVIVGSGCGSGVCAKNLAEAGHRVLVAEKSYYWPPEHLPMKESEGFSHLFMNGGFVISDESSVNVTAGQTFGGGGFVNWSASLQTQGYVRQEWADQGLPFFTSAEFQKSLDTVCERMGVAAEPVRHNPTNNHLLEGARKLGWSHKAVPQNSGGAEHYCGYCSMGCASCEKQGPHISFLPDAARAGAEFIEGLEVQKIIFEEKKGKKVAVGVRGVWASRDEHGGLSGSSRIQREVVVKAKRVIVAGGAMMSPLLLLGSGLNNPNIGRHLHLHPVSFLGAVHKERTNPWEGGILTSVVNEFENLDGKGHGAKLEAVTMLPSVWLTLPPWTGGLEYKSFAPRMKHMVGYISLARDRDTGRVYPDPADGRCRFSYPLSWFDKKNILEGVVGLAKLQYVAGASEIFTTIPGCPPFKRVEAETEEDLEGINNKKFQEWLKEIRRNGFPCPETMFLSAHQMGTCRMGASPRTSVVDPDGKVWGTEGLYVADASVFPSASGVNPMVTVMGIADWLSRNISAHMAKEQEVARL
ncbi:Glucose-methanol-choline oxidoreductase [Neofusicoccum parvum]|uniref:Glucose-methanol-choline oxidoreductase n=1 Tax=Neofusicoccum parvum TaxID=310453 RepID=A0ACB5RXA2_9PEZI|nr:Glucose-methanol-choline oxidoreductase [Neofusicoccum parvum]